MVNVLTVKKEGAFVGTAELSVVPAWHTYRRGNDITAEKNHRLQVVECFEGGHKTSRPADWLLVTGLYIVAIVEVQYAEALFAGWTGHQLTHGEAPWWETAAK